MNPRFQRSFRRWRLHGGLRACLLSLCLLALTAGSGQGQGTHPGNAIPLRLDGANVTINIQQPGQVRWVRLDYTPSMQITHGTVEGSGSQDNYLTLYRNLADAQADRELVEDDDSGPGLNASILQALGYASPMYARARMFSSSRTGSFQLGFTSSFEEPADCPGGVCFIEQAVEEADPEPAASKPLLSTLRGIRDTLLAGSADGRAITELYYDLSLDLLWEAAVDGDFRRSVLQRLRTLKPVLAELESLGTGGSGGLVFTAEHLKLASGLYDDLMARANGKNAARLQSHFEALRLNERLGQRYGQILRETGYLSTDPSRWVRLQGSRTLVARGEILVKLKPEAAGSLEQVSGTLRSSNGELDQVIHALGVTESLAVFPEQAGVTGAAAAGGLDRIFKWRLAPGADLDEALERLRALDSVEYAEPNARLQAFSQDPYFRYQYGLENREVPAADVRATEAWNLERGQRSVLLSVIDTGVDAVNGDLAGRVRVDLGFNFVDGNANSDDDHGHGTHVAGISAAAAGNRIAGAGVAPGVEILPVKVLSADGSGTAEGVAQGITHSVNRGADVINMSLGGDDFVQVIEDALVFAENRGVLVIAAAGNDGTDQLSYPARSSRVLSVAATNNQNQLASFSNYGSGLDLSAPGEAIVSNQLAGISCSWSGTSMAAPHAAGVAALLLSRHPNLSLRQQKDVLQGSALDLGSRGYDTRFGWGLVDAYGALTSSSLPQPEPCRPNNQTLCLNGGRFKVELEWENQRGQTGRGHRVSATADSGLLWFFNDDNWEMLVKVLNGCGGNGHFWVFSAATTNVGYNLTVTDTQTGARKVYTNPVGRSAPTLVDTRAFATCPAGSPVTAPEGDELLIPLDLEEPPPLTPMAGNACSPSSPGLCLLGDRFQVDVSWRDQRNRTGQGTAVPLSADNSGLLWFFGSNNWEMLVKVLNGCGGNGHYWVFAASTTNVEYTIRVRDTVTGVVKSYFNPLGRTSRTIADTRAFQTCS